VRQSLALLLVAAATTFLLGLGRAAIGDADEAFYAEAAREMVTSGDWLTPHYNYEERFQKPVLYYWLAAAAFTILGPGEAAARLPSALSGVLLVLLAWSCGRRLYGERTARLAGLITASNFGYFALGRLALPDLPLAALMTLATWAGLEASARFGRLPMPRGQAAGTREPVRDVRGLAFDRRAHGWLLLASAGAALAVLMKGPVGVALPALIVLTATRLGLLGPPRWLPVPIRALGLAGLLFVGIAAPWFVAMVLEHGVAYLHRFFVSENVERFATDRYNAPRSVFFYVPIVFGGLAPWSSFLFLWLPGLVRSLQTRRLALGNWEWVLVLWAATPLVFYSLSIGKQPRYILPLLPPLALLLAHSFHRALDRAATSSDTRRFLGGLATASALLLVTLGALLIRAVPLLAALSPLATHLTAALIIAGGLVTVAVGWWAQRSLPGVLTAVSIATLLSLHFSVFSARGTEPVQLVAAAYQEASPRPLPYATHRVFVRNLVFYTGVPQVDLAEFEDVVAFLRRHDRALAVLRDSDVERLRREAGLRPHILFSLRYFNPSAIRLKTLLWPEPSRDLEQVHLISNKK
jgi:4-amino-4-deoxy-L-arabinose transferase-like glycosyltransferase